MANFTSVQERLDGSPSMTWAVRQHVHMLVCACPLMQQMWRKFSRTNSHKNYVTFCLAIPWTSQARRAIIGSQEDEQLPWLWRHDHGRRPIQSFFWNPLHPVEYLRRMTSVWLPVKSKILYVHKGNAQSKKLKSPNHFFKEDGEKDWTSRLQLDISESFATRKILRNC